MFADSYTLFLAVVSVKLTVKDTNDIFRYLSGMQCMFADSYTLFLAVVSVKLTVKDTNDIFRYISGM